MSDRRVHRIGIIGAGHFAARHLEALSRLTDRVQIVAATRERIEIPFPPLEALAVPMVSQDVFFARDDIDAVLICSPNHLHRRHIEEAFASGKHVLCEKPLALSVADADALLRAVPPDRVLMVGHLTRHYPPYVQAADFLRYGGLGKPTAAYASRRQIARPDPWRMSGALGGGAPFDLLIHDFDLLSWYIGRPTAVMARGERHPLGAFAQIAAIFTFPAGVVAIVEGGFLANQTATPHARIRIVCESGAVAIDPGASDGTIKIRRHNQDLEVWHIEMADALTQGLVSEWTEFLEALEGVSTGRLRLADARQAVEFGAYCVEAMENGVERRFP